MLCGPAADHNDEDGDEDGNKIVFSEHGRAEQTVLLLIKYVDAVWSVIGGSGHTCLQKSFRVSSCCEGIFWCGFPSGDVQSR